MLQLIAVSLFIFIIVCTSQWVSVTDPPLPRASAQHATATYNDSIFILGGMINNKQVVQYQISSNAMIDRGVSVLPVIANNYGAYFSQWQNILYLEQGDILVYNVSSTSFPASVYTISVDPTVTIGTAACISASADRLFVLGGWTTLPVATVYILTLSDSTWSTAPSMNGVRVDLSCIVVSDYLYAIGGWMTQIERMNINDMIGFDNIGSLTAAVSMPGVASYGDIIWVIGGWVDGDHIPVDQVWNIDANDGSVILLNERLPYAIIAGQGGTIIAKDVLYVFGGKTDWNTQSANWLKLSLLETETALPTKTMTKNPTNYPTNIPSIDPSKQPSNEPSEESSNTPSYDPTPTDIPSNSPTVQEREGQVVEEIGTTKDDIDDESNNNVLQKQTVNDSMTRWIIIGILIAVFMFLLCCCFFLLNRMRLNRQVKAAEWNEDNIVNAVEVTKETVPHVQSSDMIENGNVIQTSSDEKQANTGEMDKNTYGVSDDDDDDDDDSLYEKHHDGITAGIPQQRTHGWSKEKAEINDVCIENDMVQGNIIMGGTDDGMGVNGTCSNCGKMDKGKVYQNELFYCFECRRYYEANDDGQK